MDVRAAKRTKASRILAFFCLAVLLIASVAASVHQHSGSQDATCLICHVTQRGNVVAICSDAGKPHISASRDVAAARIVSTVPDPPDSTRTPRAPPTQLLSA